MSEGRGNRMIREGMDREQVLLQIIPGSFAFGYATQRQKELENEGVKISYNLLVHSYKGRITFKHSSKTRLEST
jgi:hypothetical protein